MKKYVMFIIPLLVYFEMVKKKMFFSLSRIMFLDKNIVMKRDDCLYNFPDGKFYTVIFSLFKERCILYLADGLFFNLH